MPLPEYVLHPEDIMVTFRAKEQNGTLNETLNETLSCALSEREKTILEEIVKDPLVTQVQIAKMLKIPLITVKRYIANFQKQGILKREGSKKSGKWEVNI